MATQAHCAYAFECLAASFEHRQPLSLAQVEDLWSQYHDPKADNDDEADGDADSHDNEEAGKADMTDAEEPASATATSSSHTSSAKPPAISRLLHRSRGGSESSSQSSLPSTRSTASSTPSGSSGTEDTPATSRSSLFSLGRRRRETPHQQRYPLFVTWNVVNRSGHKTLRGCIGTFEAQDLEQGLRSYALTRTNLMIYPPGSAFEDTRFPPIPPSLLPSLSTHITLLHNFSAPTSDPLDWTLGHHGLRISFTHSARRHGATYLPDVPREQGWSKEETLVSLMRKAGWNDRGTSGSSTWRRVWTEGRGELIRYEGQAVGLGFAEWKGWREWVGRERGVGSEVLN
ncbi:hypothetical protein D0859_17234 [Hortaea werneckii]|uniref:AMMECR1 domain-containing protein n=1 Tax=Hortaea werneckii TaxID=91943 RepID=A0A3M7HZV3_HORWE|nr:hypothetical protein D0859_17234 [Hortaea werneckii]